MFEPFTIFDKANRDRLQPLHPFLMWTLGLAEFSFAHHRAIKTQLVLGRGNRGAIYNPAVRAPNDPLAFSAALQKCAIEQLCGIMAPFDAHPHRFVLAYETRDTAHMLAFEIQHDVPVFVGPLDAEARTMRRQLTQRATTIDVRIRDLIAADIESLLANPIS